MVIPKKMREALNLGEGSALEIEPAAGGLFLRVPGQASALVQKSGFLVHHGIGKADIAIPDFINQQRAGRAAGIVRVP